MMKFKVIFILLWVLSTSVSRAQIFATDSMSRVINVKALALISKYESIIKFSNKNNFDDFSGLFHSTSSVIFNDVMPENELNTKITPDEYLKLIRKYYADTSFLSVEVSPYEIGVVTMEGADIANVSILAKKKIWSIAKNGLDYTDTFNVRFDIIYEISSKKFTISTISNVDRRGSYIQLYSQVRGFGNKTMLSNDTILINDKIFKVGSNGYTLLKNTTKSSEYLIIPYHNDVMFKMYRVPDNIPFFRNKLDTKKDKNIVKINFWKWMVYADVQYHFIPNGASPIKPDNDTMGINSINNGSFSNYVMFNLCRRTNTKGYFNIKFGGGADVFNYQLNLASHINAYQSIDPDGDPYLRINKVYNIREKHQLVYVTAPLVIQKGFTFGKNSVYVEGAYYFMLKFSSTYSMDADASYSGYYDYLFGLTINENGVYDFGVYNFQLRSLPLPVSRFITSYSFGIGYNRQLSRTVYFNVGVNYRNSNTYVFDDNLKSLSDSRNGINSLTNLNNKFRIQYFNMNMGISVKI